jgi:hypothetical protein
MSDERDSALRDPLVRAADAIADAAGPALADALMAWAEILVERLDARSAAALLRGRRADGERGAAQGRDMLARALQPLGAQLQDVWRALLDAEQGRGAALAAGDDGEAQAAYEAALTLFRRIQIEIFTVLLGGHELIWEQLDAQAARLDAVERAVGEAPRVARLETRADIIDRVVFYDPHHAH